MFACCPLTVDALSGPPGLMPRDSAHARTLSSGSASRVCTHPPRAA
jgi:hypothetical protein